MNPMNDPCDHHQEVISDCLDEKIALPAPTLDHLSKCEECRAFQKLWKEDSGPLARLAAIRDLPELPPTLAIDLSAARKTVAGPWKRSFHHGWPAVAAAVAIAAGVVWWNSGGDSETADPVVVITPQVPPGPADPLDLPKAISSIDTDALERSLSAYTRARVRSLDRSGQRYARLTQNLRASTVSLSKFIPTVQ
jgi:predicted anti-sigma-YlaC factor YlaD